MIFELNIVGRWDLAKSAAVIMATEFSFFCSQNAFDIGNFLVYSFYLFFCHFRHLFMLTGAFKKLLLNTKRGIAVLGSYTFLCALP